MNESEESNQSRLANESSAGLPGYPLWFRWAQLVRLPTVFTVIAQILAAFIVAAGTAGAVLEAIPRLVLVLVAGISVYWAGMILNDVWDFEEDLRDRPFRPLPSGQIDVGQARVVAWGLAGLGIVLAGLSGVVAAGELAITLAPAIMAALLVVAVVLYNGPLKSTPLAPIMMGVCRMLCFLLGAAPLVMVGGADFMQPQTWFTDHVVAIAVAFGIYIAGITTVSRMESGDREAIGSWDLNVGMLVAIFGAVALAIAPRLAPPETIWMFAPDMRYALLIGLITFPIVMRAFRAAPDPRPELIQNLIRIGVLNIIPYSAALALLVAGPLWAFAIFCLTVIALLTSIKMRVT